MAFEMIEIRYHIGWVIELLHGDHYFARSRCNRDEVSSPSLTTINLEKSLFLIHNST
jgi:hypothetical protein